MTDPGLNHRLRQRSRRAGIMIGLSMALTIAVCVGGFSVIYAALDGFTTDFVSHDAPTAAPPTQAAPDVAQTSQTPAPTAAADSGNSPTQTPAAQPTAKPSATTSAFKPNYQITASSDVNLRSQPSTSGQIVANLPPDTPLQFLNDRQKTSDPSADGFSGDWMKFQTQDGDTGWVREIDVGTYQP